MTVKPSKFQISVGLIVAAIGFAIAIYLYRTHPHAKSVFPMFVSASIIGLWVAYLIIKRYRMTIASR